MDCVQSSPESSEHNRQMRAKAWAPRPATRYNETIEDSNEVTFSVALTF